MVARDSSGGPEDTEQDADRWWDEECRFGRTRGKQASYNVWAEVARKPESR